MTPIDKVSDIRWFPRLGKIRLGIKKEGQKGPYPSATDYFVCPEEVKGIHGDTPRELPVMFPSDDIELIAPQWFKCYSYSQGLICRGDGKHCRRKVDTETGDFANKDTREWVMTDGICEPEHCPMLGSKQCRKMMSLLFILHEVPGLGVYQLDTSSFYSIVNLNSQLAPGGFLRYFTGGKIAFIPLILSVEPREVTPPGVGRKTVHVLNVRADVKLADIIRISRQKPAQVLLPTLEEEEPPEDLYPEEVLAEAEEAATAEKDWEALSKGGEGDASTPPLAPVAAVKKEGEVVPSKPEGSEKIGGAQETKEEVGKSATTNLLPTKGKGKQKSRGESAAGAIEGEGFNIDLTWLNESLQAINWTEETAKSWLTRFKIDIHGSLADGLSQLTREQAEEFVKELNSRLEKQMDLWG